LVGLGIVAGVVGFGVGLHLGLKRTAISCRNNASFPGVTALRCFAHKQAIDGTLVVAFSLMLAILIVLTDYIALATLARRPAGANERAEAAPAVERASESPQPS
jgi:hypothetical protein